MTHTHTHNYCLLVAIWPRIIFKDLICKCMDWQIYAVLIQAMGHPQSFLRAPPLWACLVPSDSAVISSDVIIAKLCDKIFHQPDVLMMFPTLVAWQNVGREKGGTWHRATWHLRGALCWHCENHEKATRWPSPSQPPFWAKQVCLEKFSLSRAIARVGIWWIGSVHLLPINIYLVFSPWQSD